MNLCFIKYSLQWAIHVRTGSIWGLVAQKYCQQRKPSFKKLFEVTCFVKVRVCLCFSLLSIICSRGSTKRTLTEVVFCRLFAKFLKLLNIRREWKSFYVLFLFNFCEWEQYATIFLRFDHFFLYLISFLNWLLSEMIRRCEKK